MQTPFRYFNSSPGVILVAVMTCVRFPPSPRQVEYLLFERGMDICHETAWFWWNRFGPLFAAEIRNRRVRNNRCYSRRRWLDDRVENSHSPFRRRERAMAKFRDVETLMKFAAVHASTHNHFIRDRQLGPVVQGVPLGAPIRIILVNPVPD
jgi:putative transposase